MKTKFISLIGILSLLYLSSCSLFLTPESEQKDTPSITALKLTKSSVMLGVGGIEYVGITIAPSSIQAKSNVSYSVTDSSIVTVDGDSFGFSLVGKKSGNTTVRISCNGYSATCVVSVSGIDPTIENAPQITSNTIALELEKGTSKRVQVSLTGGSAADMSNFSWSIDKSSIATIDGSGQTAYITAKENGIAQVTVTHPLATYSYQFCVFVKPDNQKAIYITTQQNIMSLNRDSGERSISVSLVNGETADLPFFEWEILNNSESDSSVITIAQNGQNCIITPIKQGTAFLRVSHPKAAYSFDIRVRVITIVENVYIEPSTTQVTLQGTTPQTITAQLMGNSGSDIDITEFEWTVEDDSIIELSPFQESCGLIGLKNGSTKVIVSHPAAKYPREILVFVTNHPNGSINASMYITTSQNFIRTKAGIEDIQLHVELIGGVAGDEKDFTWTISNPSVLSATTVHGSIIGRTLSRNSLVRSIFNISCGADLYIDALTEGTAVISISHPKTTVPTEVLIKVLPQSALLEEPLYLRSVSMIGVVKGESRNISCDLYGTNKNDSDDNDVIWEIANTSIASIIGNSTTGIINAHANGETFLTISHPKAESSKKVLLIVADTEEELDSYKTMYTDKSSYNIVAGTNESLYLTTINIEDSEISNIFWSSTNPSVASVQIGTTNTSAVITGIAAGVAKITATHPSVATTVEFEITVYPVGTDIGVIPSPTYLTTNQNLVQFSTVGTTKNISITPIQISTSKYSEITWTIEDDSIASISSNGIKASVTAIKEGVTKLFIAHPESENILVITIRVGNELIITNPTIPYINISQDVLGLVNGGKGQKLSAMLVNSSPNTGYTWTIEDSNIAEISPLDSNCFVVPKVPGQTIVTVTNDKSALSKQILILVANSEDELASIKYLTTSQNVVSLVPGSQQNITIRMANNTDSSILQSGFTWSVVENPNSVQIISSGATAILKGLENGVSTIQVTHEQCTYPLKIKVQVLEQVADASTNPYITSNQNIVTITENGTAKSLTVTLVGGSDTDNTDFMWTIDRSDVATLIDNRNTAIIRGLKVGECLINVTHPKAKYPLPIKIVVEQAITGQSLYIKTSPANIISMKPADAEQTITASLVGGTPEDAYGFKWFADNYNCIELVASGNTAVIKPKAEGTALITITHPKAAFSGEVQIRITEYSTFEFSMQNTTMIEGNTQFISMRVPSMENDYGGRIVYTTDNPNIVTITGTNKVAQLTAVGNGTAIVTATSPSGSKSELMVYVKKAAEVTLPYITSTTNVLSLKTTDSQRAISATLVGQGVIATDQYNLQWAIDDPSIAGLVGTSGSTVLLKPIAPGETTVRVSHDKTNTILTMHIQVTGTAGGIALNKSYMALETGKTIEVSATIDNGTTADYNNITWSVDKGNGTDICTVMGTGKTVAVYGLAPGRTTLTAEYNGNSAKCDIIIEASRSFLFETQSMRVQPGQTKTFKYTLIPDDASITWLTNTNEYITYTVDTVNKTVSITGIKEPSSGSGLTTLSGLAQSMTASINITCAWDYKFNINKTKLQGRPDKEYTIDMTFNPEETEIIVEDSALADFVVANNMDGTGTITVTPKKEGTDTISIQFKNPTTNTVYGTKMVTLDFWYDTLTLVPKIKSQNGNFSRYDSDTNFLILGDGETVDLQFTIDEKNVDWTISDFKITKKLSTSAVTYTRPDEYNQKMYAISHPTDVIDYQYRIVQGYKPQYYNGSAVQDSNTGEYTGLTGGAWNDARLENFFWYTETDSWSSLWDSYTSEYIYLAYRGVTNNYINENTGYPLGIFSKYKYVIIWSDNGENGVQGGFFRRTRDTSLDNAVLSRQEFESIPWYYSPGLSINGIGTIYSPKRILTEHINATTEDVSNKDIAKYELTDVIEFKIIHKEGQKTQTVSIPVYIETRNCSKNQE